MSEQSTDILPVTVDETTEEFNNRIIASIETQRKVNMLRD